MNKFTKKQFMSLFSCLFISLAIMTLSHNVYSYDAHSLSEIRKTAQNFVLNQMQNPDDDIQVHVGKLDPRLRLHQCTVPLEAYRQNYETRQGRSTIGVRCDDNKPWSLYVPVSVRDFKLVATLKQGTIRNTILAESDIVFEKKDVNRMSAGYFDDIKQLKGKILTQNLTKGAVLTQHHIKSPMVVTRGQSVTIIAKSSVIEVRMKGTAMTKGAVGDRIKVKNMKSKRIIEGVIIDKNLISVNL